MGNYLVREASPPPQLWKAAESSLDPPTGLGPSNTLALHFQSSEPWKRKCVSYFRLLWGYCGSHRSKLRTREGKGKGEEKAQRRCRWGTTKMEASSRCELVFLKRQRLQRAFLKMRLGSVCSGALSGAAGTEDCHLFALWMEQKACRHVKSLDI